MKDYRLDNQEWYNSKTDQVKCLYCGRWGMVVNLNHLKKHGFDSVSEYKEEYGILPHTPLKAKSILFKLSLSALKLREKGLFNVFKKGETSIPKKWQRCDKSHTYYHLGENSKLISIGVTGIKRSDETKRKMREIMLKSPRRNSLRDKGYAFKKGHVSIPAGISYEEHFGQNKAKQIRNKISKTRFNRIKSGEITFNKVRVPSTCKVCGKVSYVMPSIAKHKKVCSHNCGGVIGGGKKGEWIKNNYDKWIKQQNNRRQGEYHKCTVCEKEFYLHPSTIQTGLFCSKECELKSKRVISICISCGKEFELRKSEAWKIKRCKSCRIKK